MPLVCPPERVLLQNLDGKANMVKLLGTYCPRFPLWPWSLLIQGKSLHYPLHVPGTA